MLEGIERIPFIYVSVQNILMQYFPYYIDRSRLYVFASPTYSFYIVIVCNI